MTTVYRELLIGCGNSREKRVIPDASKREWHCLYTLDVDPVCEPDFICDLSQLVSAKAESERFYRISCNVTKPFSEFERVAESYLHGFRFRSESFAEIHAYEVLEHIGEQGNFRLFFDQFKELWRILKPGGYLCATVPDYRSVWAFGDPGHTRVISAASLVFLSQRQYKVQLGKTAMSDYSRFLAPADFEILNCRTEGEQMRFVLRAIK